MEAEKIICTERPNNNDALLFSAMNGNNNQWNNPFIYLVWMMMLGRNGLWGNNGFGYGQGAQNIEIQGKLNELGAQMANNQNTSLMMDAINGNHEALHALSTNLGVGVAQLQNAICGVQNAITHVGGQVGLTGQQVINSVLLGNKDITSALQNCCCQQKELTLTQGFQNQLGQKDLQNAFIGRIDQLANGIQQGFASIGYENAKNTQSIINAQTFNTQRILDKMCFDENQSLRDRLAQMSQDAQTSRLEAYINARLTPTTAPATA